jgi:hypothetical protein
VGSSGTGVVVVVDGAGVLEVVVAGSGEGSSAAVAVGAVGASVVAGVAGTSGPVAPVVPGFGRCAGAVVGVPGAVEGGVGSGRGVVMALARPPDPTRNATVAIAARPWRWK